MSLVRHKSHSIDFIPVNGYVDGASRVMGVLQVVGSASRDLPPELRQPFPAYSNRYLDSYRRRLLYNVFRLTSTGPPPVMSSFGCAVGQGGSWPLGQVSNARIVYTVL